MKHERSIEPKVCVIGAGCSGITAIKNLLQAGINSVVCYEQNERIGGNWLYSPLESHSSVCETTHIISSKRMSEYMDFPMPDDYPDYPSHHQILSYFESYAKHFNLYPYIRFNTSVAHVEKTAGNQWQVHLSDGSMETFDYMLIANGHHSTPRIPKLPGDFTGRFLHSHGYKTNLPFKDQRVLVIGAGNSGCDCAVEISRVAEKVGISMRSAQYIIPKFFMGRPTDSYNRSLQVVPEFIASFLRKLTVWFQVGNYKSYGLEPPKFPVTKSHPTVNSELLYKIRHGKVHPRKAIKHISSKSVTFIDNQTEEYDVILAATGYKISFPFFDSNFLNYAEADRVPLYLRMFHADHPSLIFIGLVQPQGAVWPLSDLQSKLAANHIAGRWALPQNLSQLAEQDADYIAKEFLPSKRHTIEVHFHPYANQLKKQIPKTAPEWSSRIGMSQKTV